MKPAPYTLRNGAGLSLSASTLGGTVTSLRVPDRAGKPGNVVLSLPDVRDHHDNGYMNALIGRVGNRVSGGGFKLDGVFYPIAKNNGEGKLACALHGGNVGFDRHVWRGRAFDGADGPSLELTTFSPDGEEGYPGNLAVRVVYTLTESNAWRIEYWAVTDKPTLVNLTQHAYFNLSAGRRDVGGHVLQVAADRFSELDRALLPTGRFPAVDGTALDLRAPTRLDSVFAKAKSDRRLANVGGGLDCNYFLNRTQPAGRGLDRAAEFSDPESGRRMSVWTDQPCMQVYSANFLEPGLKGRGGAVYGPHWACCFETQHAPDSPNDPSVPSIRLDPGSVYRTVTEYRFDTFG